MDLKIGRVKYRIREILFNDISYIFFNYFVAYIPAWRMRKFFYLCGGMKIGKGSRIAMRCIVMRPSGIVIGRNNVINEYAILDGRYGLKIGDNNSISMHSKLYSVSHYSWSETFEANVKPTLIKDNCWIGVGAVILPGSVLEDKVVVGANSVLKGQAEENSIYVGNPGVKIKDRNLEKKYELHYRSWFR